MKDEHAPHVQDHFCECQWNQNCHLEKISSGYQWWKIQPQVSKIDLTVPDWFWKSLTITITHFITGRRWHKLGTTSLDRLAFDQSTFGLGWLWLDYNFRTIWYHWIDYLGYPVFEIIKRIYHYKIDLMSPSQCRNSHYWSSVAESNSFRSNVDRSSNVVP